MFEPFKHLDSNTGSQGVPRKPENSRDNDNRGFRPQDIKIVKQLGESKFPVYKVTTSQSKDPYVMKVYPCEGNVASTFFRREVRFVGFNHQNLIAIKHFQDNIQFVNESTPTAVSYMIMEYAPYGDFLAAVTQYKIPFHDKLLRTYFHQLIEGLEYLHNHNAAHLDIKPENLLMADNYTLKIADFDLSYLQDDETVTTMGTKNFRAPEIFHGACTNPQAADIYSAGIALFFLKTKGTLPYSEEPAAQGPDMAVLKEDDPSAFWSYHCKFGDVHPSFFTEDFKDLFLSMAKFNSEERATISQIKQSNWYNGSIYSPEELKEFMEGRFDL